MTDGDGGGAWTCTDCGVVLDDLDAADRHNGDSEGHRVVPTEQNEQFDVGER